MRTTFLLLCAFMLQSTASFAENESNMSNMSETTTPRVKLETTSGDIIIELNPEKAPISTENFITYVKEGFYDGTIFHRIIPGFMAQGGGFTPDFQQKPTHAPIKNEADNGLKNKRGTIAMARTPNPDSATSQFFINYQDNPSLDHRGKTPQGWGYAVFGEVVESTMYVVDEMAHIPTGSHGPHQDVPKTDIIIRKATLLTE